MPLEIVGSRSSAVERKKPATRPFLSKLVNVVEPTTPHMCASLEPRRGGTAATKVRQRRLKSFYLSWFSDWTSIWAAQRLGTEPPCVLRTVTKLSLKCCKCKNNLIRVFDSKVGSSDGLGGSPVRPACSKT